MNMSAKVIKAWAAKAAKRALALESVESRIARAEDVEIAIERRGLCQSDLSVLQAWSKSGVEHDAKSSITRLESKIHGGIQN